MSRSLSSSPSFPQSNCKHPYFVSSLLPSMQSTGLSLVSFTSWAYPLPLVTVSHATIAFAEDKTKNVALCFLFVKTARNCWAPAPFHIEPSVILASFVWFLPDLFGFIRNWSGTLRLGPLFSPLGVLLSLWTRWWDAESFIKACLLNKAGGRTEGG